MVVHAAPTTAQDVVHSGGLMHFRYASFGPAGGAEESSLPAWGAAADGVWYGMLFVICICVWGAFFFDRFSYSILIYSILTNLSKLGSNIIWLFSIADLSFLIAFARI